MAYMRRLIQKVNLIIFGIVFTFLVMEIIIRVGGTYDQNGQFVFASLTLHPLQIPISFLQKNADEYQERIDEARLIYEPNMGWTFQPDFTSEDGLYTFNKAGMRAERDYMKEPATDVLRIALFGDSFVAGDEVRNDETWAVYLEEGLNEMGIQAEVLNFGVSGFGMDQAYLRWLHLGLAYQPDIVLFGFQPSDLWRNPGIFMAFQGIHQAPFSKPRFVLEDQTLRLVNSPVLPPADIPEAIGQFPDHPMEPYAGWYTQHFQDRWWLQSKTMALVATILSGLTEKRSRYDEAYEFALATAIVQSFGADVRSNNGIFMVVHLPNFLLYKDEYLSGEPPPYNSVLEDIRAHFPLIDVTDAFSDWDDDYLMFGGHYSATGNRLVAEAIAAELETCLVDASCIPPRFADKNVFFTREQDRPEN